METHSHFIVNRVDIQLNLPVEIIPEHVLKRPDSVLVQRIKQKLALFDSIGFCKSAYEGDYCAEGEQKYHIIDLPPDRWRYWIIESHKPSDSSLLRLAAALLRNELLLGLTLITRPNGEGMTWHNGIMSNAFQHGRVFKKDVPIVGEAELQEIRDTHSLLLGSITASPKVNAAAWRFFNLKNLPESSEFMVIGLFSVIESLITHAPALTEPMDSLTHQIRTKMKLLSKRFQRPLDYESFFATADADTVWGRLYEYRSKIAHGDEADFKTRLKPLRSPEMVTVFLKEVAKLLILCALREPQLIYDLKQC